MENKITAYRSIAASTFCLMVLSGIPPAFAEAPTLDPADDASHLGEATNLLFWTPEQQVAGYRNIDKIFPTRTINAGKHVYELPEQPVDLGNVQVSFQGRVLTTDGYFSQQNVAGLLVIKNGRIVYERYGLGNSKDTRWVSFSVAKSVTSLLVGAAIRDGYIKSVNEMVTDYLPRLKESSYEQATIRNLLQMSTGVQWNEDYADRGSDINRLPTNTLEVYAYLREKPRDAAPGEVFNYNSAETHLAGTLVRSAIGNNLATYLSEKIWQPFGMEADAYWMLTEPGRGEFGGCCISATLRDYGRIGLFALGDGRLADGTRVLPDNWIAESTSPADGYTGYGYLWWLVEPGVYRASGVFGQGIYINQAEQVVIALHSARAVASNNADWALQMALFAALTDALRD